MRERLRIETRSGWIEGRLEDGVAVFRGVPYAQPPTGELRFAPPARERPWPGVRDAGRFGPAAPQRPSVLMRMLGMDGFVQDEDCLSLNVWAPPVTPGARRPVLVWLHGGAFTAGAGSMPVFDGTRLARRGDAVLVTANYRLGALGFLALPEPAESEGARANLGLLDQIAALGWVREHAACFGGDPEAVTLFGESAGAMSIGALLGAPAARGLFARAILQSGAAHNVSSWPAGLRIAELFEHALREAGALSAPLDLASLRKLPLEAILAAQRRVIDESWRHIEGLAFQPVAEGEAAPQAVLPRLPLEAVADGSARGVSLIAGTNLDEWRLFALTDPKLAQLDDAGLARRLKRSPPAAIAGDSEAVDAFAERAIAVYREARAAASAATSARDLWLAMQTDRVFRIPAVRLLEAQSRIEPFNFAYLFDWPSSILDGALGACHAVEIPFVFGTVEDERAARLVGGGPAALRLAERVQDAWLAFAREAQPGWQAYTDAQRATQRLGRECSLETDPMSAERRLWGGLL